MTTATAYIPTDEKNEELFSTRFTAKDIKIILNVPQQKQNNYAASSPATQLIIMRTVYLLTVSIYSNHLHNQRKWYVITQYKSHSVVYKYLNVNWYHFCWDTVQVSQQILMSARKFPLKKSWSYTAINTKLSKVRLAILLVDLETDSYH